MTYTKLIERLYNSHDAETLCADAALVIEALQSKLGDAIQSSAHWQHQFTEAQAENERLNSGWHQANQEALQAKLTVQVQAKNIVLLCDDLKYIAGIARRLGMPVDDDALKVRAAILGAVQLLEAERDALQSRLDAMGKGEPVAWQFRTNGKHWHVVQVCPPDDAYDKGTLSPLYAAPKALAPLTDDHLMELHRDAYTNAKAFTTIEVYRYFARVIEAAHGIGGTP